MPRQTSLTANRTLRQVRMFAVFVVFAEFGFFRLTHEVMNWNSIRRYMACYIWKDDSGYVTL